MLFLDLTPNIGSYCFIEIALPSSFSMRDKFDLIYNPALESSNNRQ